MPDAPELLSLTASSCGMVTSLWAIERTFRKIRIITAIKGEPNLRQKAYHRLVRHLLNALAQGGLLHISIVAFTQEPQTVTVQAATSRIGVAFVAMVLMVKIIVDRWQEFTAEWDGRDRRERR